MAPTLDALPEEVVISILERMPTLAERHRVAPLVCQRWRRLVNSAPQLLRSLSLTVAADEAGADKLGAFATWVLTHAARHVQQLSLEVCDEEECSHGVQQRLAVAVATIITACGTAGGLRKLRLQLHSSFCLPMYWASSLQSLRHMSVSSTDDGLAWELHKQALPSLESLALSGKFLQLSATSCLPTTLTSLRLDGVNAESLPDQVTALSRLHQLSLVVADHRSSGYSALLRLPSLRRLELHRCSSLPACLSQLTQLDALVIDDEYSELGCMDREEDGLSATEIVAAALPRLQQLTFLALDSTPDHTSPPVELTSLTNLRSFYWLGSCHEGLLPPGPWLSGLRHLAARSRCVANSLPALAAAASLEVLGLHDLHGAPDPALSSMLRGLASLPSMRCLNLYGSLGYFGLNTRVLLDCQRQYPRVSFDCYDVMSEDVMGDAWFAYLAACGYRQPRSMLHLPEDLLC